MEQFVRWATLKTVCRDCKCAVMREKSLFGVSMIICKHSDMVF